MTLTTNESREIRVFYGVLHVATIYVKQVGKTKGFDFKLSLTGVTTKKDMDKISELMNQLYEELNGH